MPPPPPIFCWKLANSLPPPPTPLQQPPQMPAADFLLPVCCCPPISCGVPCTLQHSCSYQRPPPEYFCHQTQPPPNACSRCSAASLLLPSNFLWCTLHPVPCSTVAAAHPCPLNGGAPPPPIFCCQFLALKWLTPCPPPPPLQQTLCHPCFLRPQPPQMPAADFLLPVCCCPPISCGVPCTPQHSCSLPTPAPFMAVSPPPPPPKFPAANPRRSIQQIFCCRFPAAQARPCSHPKDKQLKVCHRFGERCGGC